MTTTTRARLFARTAATAAAVALLLGAAPACTDGQSPRQPPGSATPPSTFTPDEVLDDLEQRTFRFFWETANQSNGLVPDRWPTPSFSSIAAVGFGLTAYAIGVERGYVTREEARGAHAGHAALLRERAAGRRSPQGMTGYKGFFYHFLDMKSGTRFEDTELSTVDTALLLGGVLFCQSYFDQDNPEEARDPRAGRGDLRRVDWTWAQARPPAISHGLAPGEGLHPVRLARLQRGDAGLHPGARLADPSGRAGAPGRPGPRPTTASGASATARST